MNKNLSICAVVVTYEPTVSLIRLINSIKEQVSDIIIIDNNSTSKSSIDILNSLKNNITIKYNDKNIGLAAALNQATKYAKNLNYKWLLTLDQDSEFLPNTYNLLLLNFEVLKDKNKTMIIAPNSVERIDYKQTHNTNATDIVWKNVLLNLTSGSLIKLEAFNKIGFFDEKLFIEQIDNDFCYRLKKNGYKIKVAKNICFIQEIGTATKTLGFTIRNHNSTRKYYLSRNVTFMLKRYFFTAPYTTIRYFLGGTIFSWTKVLLFEKNKLSKILYGTCGFIDGFLNIYRDIR